MKKKRILVLTDDMPWGHRSIARAINSFLKEKQDNGENIEVNYSEVKQTFNYLGDVYTFLYRYFPLSNKLSNIFLENDVGRELFIEVTSSNMLHLEQVVRKYKPDLIICSYCFHSHSLVKIRETTDLRFELWTVVADPWTSSRLSFVDGADLNLVYDGVALKQAISYGFDKKNVLVTGWWTRQEMYKNNIEKKNGEPVVFIGGGSLGTNSITKFLPILLLIKQKCTIIFNTGTDKLAFKMVAQYKKMFDRLRKNSGVTIKNLGWIDNMAEVLSMSDIVFGKAGPNFLFDVVASKKPFVAITHMGGQEDGNIDLILKKKLGWVKEGLGEAEDFLLEYLKQPEKYNKKYAKTIEIEAINNEKTMEKIWKKIKCPTKS